MRYTEGGYTVLEVVIFLTVSAAIFTSAMALMGGQNAKTQFSQSMRDIQSKMQDWLNDVSTGFAGGDTDPIASYVCNAPSSGAITLSKPVGGAPSPTPACIFLGKAVQITHYEPTFLNRDPTKIYVYTVLGRRVDSVSGALVSSTKEATPYVAAPHNTSDSTPNLTEEYTLQYGARVLSVTSKDITGNTWPVAPNSPSHLASFYLSFNTESTVGDNGSSTVRAFQYNLGNVSSSGSAGGKPLFTSVISCLELASPPACVLPPTASDPNLMGQWSICFGNLGNNQTARLTINSVNGLRATTDLKFVACT